MSPLTTQRQRWLKGTTPMDASEYDEILRTLLRIAANQEALFTKHDVLHERLVAVLESLAITQARIETLLARLRRPETNGHEA